MSYQLHIINVANAYRRLADVIDAPITTKRHIQRLAACAACAAEQDHTETAVENIDQIEEIIEYL